MFDPVQDCLTLHNAFKGIGTDEKAVISVLGHRNKQQLMAIAAEYPKHHKHDLEKNLQSELSGHFRDLAVGLVRSPTKVRTELLLKATKGAGTREKALIDVLVGSTAEELRAMQQENPAIFGKVLDDVSGDFKKVMFELLKGNRSSDPNVNDAEAAAVAEQLYKAGEGKIGTNEKVFVDVLCKHSPEFLMRVSDHYKSHHKHDLAHAIKSETSGYFEDTLLGLLKPKYIFIADRLFQSMDGLGTDDTALIYFFSVLDRPEIRQVAQLIQQRHNKNLLSLVSGDTSGDYQSLLKAILS